MQCGILNLILEQKMNISGKTGEIKKKIYGLVNSIVSRLVS